MPPPFRYPAALVIAVLLLIGSAAPGAAAAPGRAVSSTDRTLRTAAGQQNVIDYWTPARMREATPIDAPTPPRSRPRNEPSSQAGRRPHLIPGSAGADRDIPTAAPEPMGYTYPFPYTGFKVESVLTTLRPYKAVGKIFFKQNGLNYVCSGASVTGGPYQIVYTAGHCMSDGAGTWSRKVLFVPGYRNGAQPNGAFPANKLWTTVGWHQNEDLTLDLGAFDVFKNAQGKKLRAKVGKLGFAYDLPRDLHWNSFGYPAEAPFTGGTLNVCQASYAADDAALTGDGPPTMAIGCDMTGGSSGGPWIYRLKKGNYINGLNSYGYDVAQPDAMYSPYFGTVANALRCQAATRGASTTC